LLFHEEFTYCTQGAFAVMDFQPEDSVTWWGVETKVVSPPCALYLGDPTTLSYETNSSVHVKLTSPLMTIPQEGAWRLLMELDVDAEPVPDPLYPYDYDVLFLDFVEEVGGTVTPLFSTKDVFNDTEGQFVTIAVELTPVLGKTGRFVFDFDTIDSTDNDHDGIFLDDVRLDAVCPYCMAEKKSECDDGDECTEDECVQFINEPALGTCVHTPIPDC